MTATPQAVSALFLRETELREGLELLYLANGHLMRSIDATLAREGLGRAHHRALYFIARRPNLSVGDLLGTLAITKQSLGRVLHELTGRALVDMRPGDRDRRQRLLHLTDRGHAVEAELFDHLRAQLSAAYARAGQQAVGGFWAVLEGLIPDVERVQLYSRRTR